MSSPLDLGEDGFGFFFALVRRDVDFPPAFFFLLPILSTFVFDAFGFSDFDGFGVDFSAFGGVSSLLVFKPSFFAFFFLLGVVFGFFEVTTILGLDLDVTFASVYPDFFALVFVA